jgi:hypothetical protein
VPWPGSNAGVQPVRPETAGADTSTADEIAKLAALKDQGSISDEEFQHAKAKLLGKQPEPVARPTPTGAR